MKQRVKLVAMIMTALLSVLSPLYLSSGRVFAAVECEKSAVTGQKVNEDCVDTNVLSAQSIDELLKLVVDILIYGLGVAATLGVIIAGIMYLTARSDPQQVNKARARLIEISIGLAAWAMLAAFLKFLLPAFTGI